LFRTPPPPPPPSLELIPVSKTDGNYTRVNDGWIIFLALAHKEVKAILTMSSNDAVSFPKLERALGMKARILARSSQELSRRGSLIVQEGARNCNNGRKASDYIHSVEQKVNEISSSMHDNVKLIQDSVLRSNTMLQCWVDKTKLKTGPTSSALRIHKNRDQSNGPWTEEETVRSPVASIKSAVRRGTTISSNRENSAQDSQSSSHQPPSSCADRKIETDENHDDDHQRTQSLEWRNLVAATRVWRQSKLCTIFKKMRINAQRRILWKKKWSRKLRYWGNLVHLTFRCPELHGTSEGQEENFIYGEEDAREHYKWRLLKIGFVRWCLWVGWRGKRVYPPNMIGTAE